MALRSIVIERLISYGDWTGGDDERERGREEAVKNAAYDTDIGPWSIEVYILFNIHHRRVGEVPSPFRRRRERRRRGRGSDRAVIFLIPALRSHCL